MHKSLLKTIVPAELKTAAKRISEENSRSRLYIVGGFLFDSLRDVKPKDIDLLLLVNTDDSSVYLEIAKQVLNSAGRIIKVRGENFPVFEWKPNGSDNKYEVSLGRSEDNTTPQAYNQQSVTLSSSLIEDLRRRIFTVKAMAYDIESNNLYDPFNGVADIKLKLLRPVSEYFTGSIERVLIAAQTLARAGRDWRFHDSVYAYSAIMKQYVAFGENHKEAAELGKVAIPQRQIWQQVEKAADGDFALFWEALLWLGWLEFFPEIDALRFVPQDKIWHPEGTVFSHTMLALRVHKQGTFLQKLSVLLHDIGKLDNTQLRIPKDDYSHFCHNWDWVNRKWEQAIIIKRPIDRTKVTAYGHDKEFKYSLQSALISMGNECMFSESPEFMFVSGLISTHMWRAGKNAPTQRQTRKIFRTLESHGATIDDLIYVTKADSQGRDNVNAQDLSALIAQCEFLKTRFKLIKPKNNLSVTGKDLIELGFIPGKIFSKILRFADILENEKGMSKEEILTKIKETFINVR